MLTQAKRLRDNPETKNVHICQLLSREELDRVKNLRRRCDDLNKDASLCKDGRKRYVVISGKLFSRSDYGKLSAYSLPATSGDKSREVTALSSVSQNNTSDSHQRDSKQQQQKNG